MENNNESTHKLIWSNYVNDPNKLIAVPKGKYDSKLERVSYEVVGEINLNDYVNEEIMPPRLINRFGGLSGWGSFEGMLISPYEISRGAKGDIYLVEAKFSEKDNARIIEEKLSKNFEGFNYFGNPAIQALFVPSNVRIKPFQLVEWMKLYGLNNTLRNMREKTSFLVKNVGIFEKIPKNLFNKIERDNIGSESYLKPHIEILDDNDFSVDCRIWEAKRTIKYKQKDMGGGI